MPLLPWSSDPRPSAQALLGPDDRDLLILDEAVDQMAIVPQLTEEKLLDRLGGSVYGRVSSQVALATENDDLPSAAYLLVDLAWLRHATVLATTGALVGLLVAQSRRQPITAAVLTGISGQAQCWLQQAGISEHQLLQPQGVTVLRQLFQQLQDQGAGCDAYVPQGCDTRAGRLALEAVTLLQGNLRTLQLPESWQLLRVAAFERH